MAHEIKHVSAKKIAEDVVIREAKGFTDPAFTNGNLALCENEIAFFKANGFLLKRGFLDEKKAFDRIVDYVWENVPRKIFTREDRQSWVGAPGEQWTEEDSVQVGQIQGGSWKMRSRDGIGTEPFFLDKIANHPRMREQVALFIGEPVKLAKRARGVYAQFPKQPGTDGSLFPHADYTAGQMAAMVFVDEIPQRCGGFTVWPGSHLLLHPFWDTVQSGSIGSESAAAEYAKARDTALNDITPLEFSGRAGDVLFWHPRLLHSAGINHSAEHDRQILRLIVPCDYQLDGLDFFDDPIHGPGPNHQWWVDTRHFNGDTPTTPENIWEGWAFGT